MKGIVEGMLDGLFYVDNLGYCNLKANPRDAITIDPMLGHIYLSNNYDLKEKYSTFSWKKI